MPATNAVSERFASAFHLIKSYLRTSMSQLRMNNLMVLHIHKQSLDQLSMVEVANDLVAESEHRLTLFGIMLLIMYMCIFLQLYTKSITTWKA